MVKKTRPPRRTEEGEEGASAASVSDGRGGGGGGGGPDGEVCLMRVRARYNRFKSYRVALVYSAHNICIRAAARTRKHRQRRAYIIVLYAAPIGDVRACRGPNKCVCRPNIIAVRRARISKPYGDKTPPPTP